MIIFTFEKISGYVLIHFDGFGNHGIDYENLDIWLIKFMFVCKHVGVLKQSSFMHSLFAQDFNLAWISVVFIFTDFPCK